MKPIVVDLFCGAGGIAKGYKEASFYVIGIDNQPQPNYAGDEFILGDVFKYLRELIKNGGRDRGRKVVAIHASPPCQAWSDLQRVTGNKYPELIVPTRKLLKKLGLPYVIENVEGAPLENPTMLCGTMFKGLRVLRHRLFETNWEMKAPRHPKNHPLVFTHDKRKSHYGRLDQNVSFVQVTGGGNATIENKRKAMGIDWPMTNLEVNEAIPPAYGKYIGKQLRKVVNESLG
jgi:DNA (cytosine-5)-methyltransferase 1